MGTELTQERLKELFSYDPQSGNFTRNVDGRGGGANGKPKAGDIAGSMTGHGYLHILIDKKRYQNHRLAWLYVYGRWPEGQIDHINGIRSDNRLENLRDVSQGTNLRNRTITFSKTGFLGVTSHSAKWRARITISNKNYDLGVYHTKEEATAAYLGARKVVEKLCL